MNTASTFEEIPIKKINVKERLRKDLGSLQPLANSISQIGLLHPITVRQEIGGDFTLLVGFRRLQAHELLGLTTIHARILGFELE